LAHNGCGGVVAQIGQEILVGGVKD
jgi:hypothetical protein